MPAAAPNGATLAFFFMFSNHFSVFWFCCFLLLGFPTQLLLSPITSSSLRLCHLLIANWFCISAHVRALLTSKLQFHFGNFCFFFFHFGTRFSLGLLTQCLLNKVACYVLPLCHLQTANGFCITARASSHTFPLLTINFNFRNNCVFLFHNCHLFFRQIHVICCRLSALSFLETAKKKKIAFPMLHLSDW